MRRPIASFGPAMAGLIALLRTEPNARNHLAITVLVIIAGLGLGIGAADWRWIIAAFGMVWVAESFNTALERLCDTLHPERDDGIGMVKDLAAGAVLAAAITAAGIGILVFWPYLFG